MQKLCCWTKSKAHLVTLLKNWCAFFSAEISEKSSQSAPTSAKHFANPFSGPQKDRAICREGPVDPRMSFWGFFSLPTYYLMIQVCVIRCHFSLWKWAKVRKCDLPTHVFSGGSCLFKGGSQNVQTQYLGFTRISVARMTSLPSIGSGIPS